MQTNIQFILPPPVCLFNLSVCAITFMLQTHKKRRGKKLSEVWMGKGKKEVRGLERAVRSVWGPLANNIAYAFWLLLCCCAAAVAARISSQATGKLTCTTWRFWQADTVWCQTKSEELAHTHAHTRRQRRARALTTFCANSQHTHFAQSCECECE